MLLCIQTPLLENPTNYVENTCYQTNHPDRAHLVCYPAKYWREYHLAYGVDGHHPPEQLQQVRLVHASEPPQVGQDTFMA